MNKLAEKIVPIMNEQELDQLIIDHYLNQAQTLTTGAEANLLKFREIIGKISPEQRTRWEEIKRTFKRNLVLGAAGNDNVAGQLIGQISTLADGLGEIRSAVELGIQAWREPAPASENQSPMEQLTLVQLGQIVQEFSKFNESLTDLKSALTNSLKETSRGDHEMAPQRIHVVNKVPQAFLDIIRYQFETLERWLDPINKLAASMPPAKRLSKTAKKVADNYKNIVKELEARAENETEDL
jgi:hypothetical protein